ncbi:MAG: response regulator, partial [Bryobacteraceae bacterium]
MGETPVRVLIVDDNPEDREAYQRILRKTRGRAWLFSEAETGAEGRERYRIGGADCILLDYSLPDGSGIEFLEELGASDEVPVLMLTGQGSEHVAVEAMKLGAVDYLVKGSITDESLGRAVAAALEHADAARVRRVHHAQTEAARVLSETRSLEEARPRLLAAIGNALGAKGGAWWERDAVIATWGAGSAGRPGPDAVPVRIDAGTTAWIEWFGRSAPASLGIQIGQFVERLRAEDSLLDFFENAPFCVLWLGADGTILRANRAELDSIGYPVEEYT